MKKGKRKNDSYQIKRKKKKKERNVSKNIICLLML